MTKMIEADRERVFALIKAMTQGIEDAPPIRFRLQEFELALATLHRLVADKIREGEKE